MYGSLWDYTQILYKVWYLGQVSIVSQKYPIVLISFAHKTMSSRIERDMCTPMFIAALFTIARTWKQPRCPSADEWIRKIVVHIHNGIFLSYWKEHVWISSNEVDETGAYYTESNCFFNLGLF